ncbi:MAG: hypothetical protein ACYDBJ_10615 [Aggregatilineales bacterium]
MTERPLALASALAKVWAALAGAQPFECVPSFSGQSDLIETQIERLMTAPQTWAVGRWRRLPGCWHKMSGPIRIWSLRE